MKRIFVVGIARSGTTLLQSLIGSHPRIETFPESHLLLNTIRKERLFRLFHRFKPEHAELVRTFLTGIHQSHLYQPYGGRSFSINAWTAYVLSTYDRIAQEAQKECWLEKTPMHLHYIDLIESNSDACFFIHVVREPISNIAALYDVSKAYPDTFFQNTIKKALDRYRKEIRISAKYLGTPGHQLVHYEEMMENPGKVAKRVCEGLALPFDEAMLDYTKTAAKITHSKEAWKSKNTEKIKKEDKILKRLTKDQLGFLKAEVPNIQCALLDYYE